MIIKRYFENGKTDVIEVKTLQAFKVSPAGKEKNMIAYAIIEAVTQMVIALIKKKRRKSV